MRRVTRCGRGTRARRGRGRDRTGGRRAGRGRRGRCRWAGSGGKDSDVGGSSAEVALSRDDLIVEGTERQAVLRPGVEVVLDGDGTAHALCLTDGPVLVECGCADDRRLVRANIQVDLVSSAVRGNRALVGAAGRRIVRAEALDDVVLDERVGEPAVDGQV